MITTIAIQRGENSGQYRTQNGELVHIPDETDWDYQESCVTIKRLIIAVKLNLKPIEKVIHMAAAELAMILILSI